MSGNISMTFYLLISGLSMGIFYLYYNLLLKNNLKFSINRSFLLFAVLFSNICPVPDNLYRRSICFPEGSTQYNVDIRFDWQPRPMEDIQLIQTLHRPELRQWDYGSLGRPWLFFWLFCSWSYPSTIQHPDQEWMEPHRLPINHKPHGWWPAECHFLRSSGDIRPPFTYL